MQQYDVIQFVDDVVVYLDNESILKVERKYKWSGKLISKFFQSGKLILETEYDDSFWRKFLAINYQDLPDRVELSKYGGKYSLLQGNNVISLKYKFFSSPLLELYCNDILKGTVESSLKGITMIPPSKYRVSFDENDSCNLYLLLFYLMNMSTIIT